ncbi:MAG: PQQ-binding-like beta-propeller repeat protein, partial [Gammaproteobacteria bacterium]|nr:PQQ-binding-like beta-propeller repeat protein [Gammaproteobacteria bacterium]
AVVSPSLTAAGCGAFTLTAVGTGFVPSSVLNWQGSPLATTFVTATTLRATVPASLLASAGSRTVTVVSPAPGGGSSAGRSVTVSPAGEPTTQAVAYQVDAGHTGVASSLCPDSLADDPLWDVPVGGTASYPLIAGGRVFVTVASPAPSNETVLLALDANSGTVLWGPVVVAGDAGFYGRADAAFANGTVFVAANRDPALPVNVDNGARPGSVQAYSAATGTLLWRTAIEQNGSSTDVGGPVAANGRVYINVRTAVGTLQAFDQATGARQIVVSAGFGSARPPAVTADAVILSDPCGTAAFSPATGDPLWSQSEGCSTGAIGVPIIAGDAVYSATGGFG